MKKVVLVFLMLSLVVGGYLVFTAIDSKAPVVIAAKKTYSTTVYIAGHGGHFAKADVTIDPNNADNPVKIKNLDMLNIGTTVTHKTHDARIDAADSNTLFWSTYALDDKGKQHVGKSDLRTGKVIKDVAMDPDPRAPGKTGPLYCASGQSKNYYMPIFMGSEGYVDVIDKKTMELKHRVFISDLGYKAGSYQFVHGINSNDLKKFLISIVMKGEDGKVNGKQDMILVDLSSLEKGKMKQLSKATIPGEPGKTITFRQYFSKDDKLIFQAAGDRIWVINAATLKLVDEKTTGANGQTHDFMPTPDAKYGLMTLRTNTAAVGADGKPVVDGTIMLYDAGAKQLVGKPVSTCMACHKNMGVGESKPAVLCGMDANYKI